jgi:signal recognition particle receptor subunit beta
MPTLYAFVTGPSGSGKSQLLYSLGDSEAWWQDEETGLEHRHVVVDDTLDVDLICAIDAARFDQLLQIPQRDLLGYIVMIDSTDPDTWHDARIMIANCRGYARLPMVIAANKQDLPGAYAPEQIGAWLGMETMMQVCGCNATDPQSARNVLLQLLYSVNQEFDRLDALIAELEKLSAQSESES